jgi:hypothetical protein
LNGSAIAGRRRFSKMTPQLPLHTKEIASMAGASRIFAGVVAMSLCVTSSAQAFGACWWYGPPAVSYYFPGPVYYFYPRVIAVPDALPTPAPPSQAGEPPQHKLDRTASDRAPIIITTRALAAGASATPTRERFKIGFWNLTGRDITLTVEGKTRNLPKNRALTLELEREFSWQADRLPAHIERVPDGLAVHEVVIRD